MKKQYLINRMLAFLFALIMVSNMALPARADGMAGESIEEPMIVVEEGLRTSGSAPTVYFNLASNSYTATFHDLGVNRKAYTQRYFTTSSGALHLRCSIWSTGTTANQTRYVLVQLYKKTTGSWVYTDSRVIRTTSTTALTSLVDFENLELNAFYCIRVENDSSANSNSNMTVSGTIVIND